ncbi:MAG: lyase family protein [Candidatus Berkelbacteria bacterium]|nr:lyase family protein [Candidatus Berkelbacteria bacterium]
MPTVAQLVAGYGPDFPSLAELFALEPNDQELLALMAPIPELGRYFKSVVSLRNVTSDYAVGVTRFRVIAEALLALSDTLSIYNGLHADKKVVHSLSKKDHELLLRLARSPGDVFRAQKMEKFTEHDTAAAIGYTKIKMGVTSKRLEKVMEGAGFGLTSEDTMGPVFGLVANCLVFGNFIPRLLNFMERCLDYVDFCEQDGPLVLPGETHQQAAEPTTFGKRVLTNLFPIWQALERMSSDGHFMPFSGKFGGAIGNMTNLKAAYPDIDWDIHAYKLINDRLGLSYDEMTFQSSTYGLEAIHFSEIANILTHLVKLVEDFMNMGSCPYQGFVKLKKKGTVGSTAMPNKSNPWAQEGAVAMLLDTQSQLDFLARSLPRFPREGNMARSYLMRTIGRRFMPAFIALDRIDGEMIGDMRKRGYVPNLPNIQEYFDKYPGMAGSSIQTVLKREGIEGDAYRAIEKIAINPDGTYANAAQFRSGLEEVMAEFNLPDKVRDELRLILEPSGNIGDADILAKRWASVLREDIAGYRQMCTVHPHSLVDDETS